MFIFLLQAFTQESYPAEWENYSLNQIFAINLQIPSNTLPWTRAIEDCYDDPNFDAISLNRTLSSLAQIDPGSKEISALKDNGFFDRWFDHVRKYFNDPQLGTRETSNILNSLAKLRLPQYLQELEVEKVYQVLPTMNAQDIANTLNAFAKLRFTLSLENIRKLYQAYIKEESYNSIEVSSMIWSLTILDFLKEEKYFFEKVKDLIAQLLKLRSEFEIGDPQIISSVHSYLLASKYYDLLFKPYETFEGSQDDFDNLFSSVPRNDATKGELKMLPSSCEKQVWFNDIASYVDGYDDKTKTVYQVDGPSHFLSDGSEHPGDLLINHILNRAGYSVVRIQYDRTRKVFPKFEISNEEFIKPELRPRDTETSEDGAYQISPSMKAQNIVNTLNALAEFKFPSSVKNIKELYKNFMKQNRFNSINIGSVIWSLTILDFLKEEKSFLKEIKDLITQLLKLWSESGIGDPQFIPPIQSYLLASKYYDLPFKPYETFEGSQDDFDYLFSSVPQNKATQEELEMLPSSCETQVWFDDIASYVDGYDDKTKTVYQVDGPTHFLSDRSERPGDLLINYILNRAGYSVVRIQYDGTQKVFPRLQLSREE